MPLAVDLDGTLSHGDTFGRAMLRFLRAAPWNALILVAWLARGRPYAKARLAKRFPCNPLALRYDARVLDWLKQERAEGRTIVLATGSDQHDAQRVADHLGLFDRVLASDGQRNMKARRKAEKLSALFPQGFVYAGNETADLAVWAAATSAVIVNASPALERRVLAKFKIERSFPRQRNTKNRTPA